MLSLSNNSISLKKNCHSKFLAIPASYNEKDHNYKHVNSTKISNGILSSPDNQYLCVSPDGRLK